MSPSTHSFVEHDVGEQSEDGGDAHKHGEHVVVRLEICGGHIESEQRE